MKRPEQELQKATATLLDTVLPGDAVWFHSPNGGRRSKAEAGIFKAMGVKAGVPDIVIVWNRQVYMIELKGPKGSLSDAQKALHPRLRDAGAFVQVAASLDEVQGYLDAWQIPTKGRIAA